MGRGSAGAGIHIQIYHSETPEHQREIIRAARGGKKKTRLFPKEQSLHRQLTSQLQKLKTDNRIVSLRC